MIETKLEAGMYIRTEDGKIGKITKVKNKYCIYADILSLKDWPMSTLRIAKASHNIIDLIEVGDFITYKQSNIFWNIPTRVSGRYNRQQEISELVVDDTPLKNIEITSVLTHEVFERGVYKI